MSGNGERRGSRSEEPSKPPSQIADDPPPFLGAWKRVYVAVVFYLVALIAAMYAFTKAVAP